MVHENLSLKDVVLDFGSCHLLDGDLQSVIDFGGATSVINLACPRVLLPYYSQQGLFIYCAIRNLNVNIGQLIADEISVCANTSNNKAPLGHPSLITHLCKIAGVDTSAPPFERPRKAIDEAYYRQYCGGEEAVQPIPPRRARRERGQAQSQTSVETHEA
ncbi:hypothetical protein LR48_Vigan05g105700 [Vigna angularis]|uniref:Putative plant transposon protein domain-containing protein n=1 Tax=Phaseolus angularis TaxID=3914 RepID=A0A0L9UL46_PHAAN|nr:hypothetical protein LR48_Vigan05g105700 [Vigna angularis]